MHATSRLSLALAFAASAFATSAQAQVVITTTPLPVLVAPGLTAFATTGADMAGLSVTVGFAGGVDTTFPWLATGPSSGGVFTPSWSLTLTGDSFTSPWMFSFLNPAGAALQLRHLALNGTTGLTIFDRTLGGVEGTPGSANGLDFAFAGGSCAGCNALVNYSGQTAINAAPAVGDLWQVVDISFVAGTGPRENFSFVQDTDNDIRAMIPETETYALMLGGLGLMTLVAKRRRPNSRSMS
jgi:hypothetical protein